MMPNPTAHIAIAAVAETVQNSIEVCQEIYVDTAIRWNVLAQAEITRLRGELALIEEKLSSLPPDVSTELAEARKVSEAQSAEVAALESEVATLEAKKRSVQKEFEAYQTKYQIK